MLEIISSDSSDVRDGNHISNFLNRRPEMVASRTNHQVLNTKYKHCKLCSACARRCVRETLWVHSLKSGGEDQDHRKDGKVHTWKDLEDRGQSWASASSRFRTQGLKAPWYKLRWLFGSVLQLNTPVSLSRWKKRKARGLQITFVVVYFRLARELSTTVCCLLSWRRRRNFRLIIFWSSNTNLLPIVVSSHFECDCDTYRENMQSPR